MTFSEQIFSKLKYPRSFPLASFGTSMIPLLWPSDIVYIKKAPFQQIKVNDIVMIQKRGKIFIHRAVYKRPGNDSYLITKGDNNLISDEKVYSHQIVGVVYQIKRGKETFKPEDMYLLQSTSYFQEIIGIKKALEKEKIDFVFLKGLPLHLYYEKSHPNRIYADCDILIRKKDQNRAENILEHFGYRKGKTAYSKIHQFLKDKPTESVYYKKMNNIPVVFDIHYEIVFLLTQIGRMEAFYPQRLLDDMTKRFLNEKRRVKIDNHFFPILSMPHLIIYLSLHFFHHNYRGIFRLELLSTIIKKSLSDISYRKIVRIISEYQLYNFVYPVFLLVRKYYQINFPAHILNAIRPNERRLHYVKKNILTINIFDDKTRILEGIDRFIHLFFLSPNSLPKRVTVIFNPQVIYSFLWTITLFAKRLFIKSLKSF